MTSFITITAMDVQRMRKNFNEDLQDHLKQNHKKPSWTPHRIASVLAKIDLYNSRDPATRESNQYYYYFSKYDVQVVNGKKILIAKHNDLGRIVPTDEYFDVIMQLHLDTDHGGRKKMFHHVKGKMFIPSIIMGFFTRHCHICCFKKALQRGWGAAVLFDLRVGYLDMIDMTATPDSSDCIQRYKYILHYYDQTTKYSVLRPLTTDSVDEAASELLKIFLEQGGPALLDSPSIDFTREVVATLINLCPKSTILAALRQPNMNKDEKREPIVKNYVTTWMAENSSSEWSKGVYLVAKTMNNTYDDEIKMTPYEAVYGYKQNNGVDLISMGVPKEVAETVETEDDLRNILAKIYPDVPGITNSPRSKSSKHASESLDSDYPWCWVCQYEDEGVAFSCSLCNSTMHEACGKYNTLMKIVCNCCINKQPQVSSGIIIVKDEPPNVQIEFTETKLEDA